MSATPRRWSRWLRSHGEEFGPLIDVGGRVRNARPLGRESAGRDAGRARGSSPFQPEAVRSPHEAGARVGMGRYDEARLLYGAPGFHAEGNDRDMPRTVHIGLDLFVEAGTPVLAPLPGVVESVRDNGMDRDYGPTVILRHEPPAARSSTRSTATSDRELPAEVPPGADVDRGQPIATVGALDVNGGWPPHLHFQIITDLLDREGEFPGRGASRPAQLSGRASPRIRTWLPGSRRIASPRHTAADARSWRAGGTTSDRRSASPIAARSPSCAAGSNSSTTRTGSGISTR